MNRLERYYDLARYRLRDRLSVPYWWWEAVGIFALLVIFGALVVVVIIVEPAP
jgi:hypothetical protein